MLNKIDELNSSSYSDLKLLNWFDKVIKETNLMLRELDGRVQTKELEEVTAYYATAQEKLREKLSKKIPKGSDKGSSVKGIVGIPNIGNCCYMNAANQCLFRFPSFVSLLYRPLQKQEGESDNHFKERKLIKEVLKQLYEVYQVGNKELLKIVSMALRSVILKSELRAESGREPQECVSQDIDMYIMVAMMAVGYQVEEVMIRKGQHESLSEEHVSCPRPEPRSMLKVSLNQSNTLQKLVQKEYQETVVKDIWKMQTIKGVISVDQFTEKPELLNQPDFLVLHMKRFKQLETMKLVKINDPIDLAGNWEIDMSTAFGAKEKVPYKVMGFAIHQGNIGGGHYISYVNEQGKWYKVDDLTCLSVEEKTAFDEAKQGYVYFLQKVKPQITTETTEIT